MSRPVSRRTKIVATIGPASDSDITIAQLMRAGVDVFRLNFSHGEPEHHATTARRIRHQAALAGRHVGILADLQGPKIRIGGFRDGSVELSQGNHFRLDAGINEKEGGLQGVGFTFEALTQYLQPGDTLLLDDGRIQLRVDNVEQDAADCTVLVGGQLGSRKGINRLGGGIAAPALTTKDIADIESLDAVVPDFVAVSFVSHIGDIEHTQALLTRHGLSASIIAKIERAEVVADSAILDGILQASAGIMVARGDLGVEVGDAELIGIQKDLISRARRANRLVITATQMMESMISSAMPTRAEVFDVANAVLDGTDAVMLSAETAVGKYPVAVVVAMSDAAMGAERHPVARTSRYRIDREFHSAQETIAMSAIYAANHYRNVRGIACLTESGATPRLMSRLSSGLPIFALASSAQTLQRLSLCRGVIPLYFPSNELGRGSLEARAIDFLRDLNYLQNGDDILLSMGDEHGRAGSTNIMKIIRVDQAM
ncbi:MAG: pyruvate kinase [Chromatocurvus sp.]